MIINKRISAGSEIIQDKLNILADKITPRSYY